MPLPSSYLQLRARGLAEARYARRHGKLILGFGLPVGLACLTAWIRFTGASDLLIRRADELLQAYKAEDRRNHYIARADRANRLGMRGCCRIADDLSAIENHRALQLRGFL